MLNFAINNETTKRANSLPFLTDNLIYKGYDVMAGKTIPESEIIGKRFGRWTVTGHAESRNGYHRFVKVKCNCGTESEVRISVLTCGRSTSCGCIKRDAKYNLKHGFCGTPLYHSWRDMKDRCGNKNNASYENYGGRGITICNEWVDDPQEFCQWAIKNGWEEGLLIDRILVDGDYEPGNVRFVNKGVSNRNTQLLPRHNTSGFRGVSFHKRDKKWNSQIKHNRKIHYLGMFATPEAAARAYDHKAKELDAAYPLNFPD